jgi:hypothetical protein
VNAYSGRNSIHKKIGGAPNELLARKRCRQEANFGIEQRIDEFRRRLQLTGYYHIPYAIINNFIGNFGDIFSIELFQVSILAAAKYLYTIRMNGYFYAGEQKAEFMYPDVIYLSIRPLRFPDVSQLHTVFKVGNHFGYFNEIQTKTPVSISLLTRPE